jgi:hypothetical protein
MTAVASATTSIRALRSKHTGETVWIIASGPSLDFVDPSFFVDKMTIVCNEAHRDWPTTYMFSHHGECCQEAIDKGLTVVTSEFHCGQPDWGRNEFDGEYFIYKGATQQPPWVAPDLSPLVDGSDDTLISTPSTVSEALHFSVYLGAAAIMLCGVDCAAVDGRWNYRGYNSATVARTPTPNAGPGNGTAPEHIRLTHETLRRVVAAVRAKGVGVYSLHPWIGLGLEGHRIET